MQELRAHDVQPRQERREGDLPRLHHQTRHRTRLEKGHADDEVHPLVLRLLEERENEAVVTLQLAQRAEVAEHAAKHARHAGDRLEDDQPG